MSSDDDSAFEKLLVSVGDNGIYQKRLLWWFVIPLSTLIPWVPLVAIFQSSIPDHWCHVPGRPDNITVDAWKNMTIPWVKRGEMLHHSSCEQYSELSETISGNVSIVACQNGWEYDVTWYDNTLPMQFDWVCEKDSYVARWLSVGVAGNVVGTLLFTVLSDLFGRKPIIIFITQLFGVSAIVKLYVTSGWAHAITMFVNSLVFPSILEICIILALEQVSGDMRAQITSMSFNMWTIGMSALPLIAWLCRSWFILGIVTAIPFFPFILGYWLLLESPRWTLSTGKVEETVQIFEKIAKINRVEHSNIRNNVERYISTRKECPKASYLSFLELFSLPVVRKRTILLTLTYMCNNLVYYGLIYNISNMSGNEFLNFFFISITELPANLFAWFCAQTFGRRWSGTGFFFVCTACASVTAIIPSSWGVAMTTILVICKAVINGSFLVVYIQLAEIYPTSHRASGAGLSSVMSSIVGISGPYIAYSSVYWFKLPYVIIFLLSLSGAVVSSFLPETLGAKMPQNIKEADEFLTDQKYFSYLGKACRKKENEGENILINKLSME